MAHTQQSYAISPGTTTTCSRGGCTVMQANGSFCNGHTALGNNNNHFDGGRAGQPEGSASPYSTPKSSEKKAKRSRFLFAPKSKPAPVNREPSATDGSGAAQSPINPSASSPPKHQHTHSPSGPSSDSRLRGPSNPRAGPLQATSDRQPGYPANSPATDTLASLYQLSSARPRSDNPREHNANNLPRFGRVGPLPISPHDVIPNRHQVARLNLPQNYRAVSSPLPVERQLPHADTSHRPNSVESSNLHRGRFPNGFTSPKQNGASFRNSQAPPSKVVIDLTADDFEAPPRVAVNSNGSRWMTFRGGYSNARPTLPVQTDRPSNKDPVRYPVLINQPTNHNAEQANGVRDRNATPGAPPTAAADSASISSPINQDSSPHKRKAYLLSQAGTAEINGIPSSAAIENAFSSQVKNIFSSVRTSRESERRNEPGQRNGSSDRTTNLTSVKDSLKNTDGNGSTSTSAAETDRKARVAQFDSAAFDSLLYSQEGALSPPPGVHVERKKDDGLVQQAAEPQYLYTDPSIHGMHNRSDNWHRRKAIDIETRPRRKEWFGKVIERQRWLSRQRTVAAEKRVSAELAGVPLRKDPKPWTHRVPVDFGDVAEEDLPEDVKDDPVWMSICARFRHDKALKEKKEKIYRQKWKTRKLPSNGDEGAQLSAEQQAGNADPHSRRLLEAEQETQQFFRDLKDLNSPNYRDNYRRHRGMG